MKNGSARNLWGDYLDTHINYAFVAEPKVVFFGNNENDANTMLELVLSGHKRARSYSLLGLQHRKENLPQIGDFTILTDWEGRARCILRTVAVRLKPYFAMRESFTKMEGIGDGTLNTWKKVQWEYYSRELEPFGREPRDSMIVVCEVFEKVFQR